LDAALAEVRQAKRKCETQALDGDGLRDREDGDSAWVALGAIAGAGNSSAYIIEAGAKAVGLRGRIAGGC
jgi:hypothetical protein